MTNLDVLENKISTIQKYLRILEGLKSNKKEAFENDLTLKGALERYLFLLAQATIDLAEAVISFKELRKPSTYAESFKILLENKLISTELCSELVKMAGFRNIIVHDYADIDSEITYDVLVNKTKEVEKFIQEIKEYI